MKQFKLLALILPLLTVLIHPVIAQHQVCGTPDLDVLTERLLENKERVEDRPIHTRNETNYIPIKFHLVAKSNGSGRVDENSVYQGLCQLNEAYENLGLQFYIKDNSFGYIDNDNAYNNPVPGMLILSVHRDPDAINIFVTGQAGSGPGGTTLGYYSPQDDWIIIRKDQITAKATVPHEVGHFFSLLHTFNGWECEPYDEDIHGNPVSKNIAPCNSSDPPFGTVAVELNDHSNCENAGDYLCDTEPDYNFGLGWDGCDYTEEVKDPNGEVVDPMENNFMGYFLDCSEYEFTPAQIDVILADYNSPARDYIRTDYEPSEIVDPTVGIIKPSDGTTTTYRDFIEFDWEDVDGATFYILEINHFFANFTNPDYRFVVEGQSEFVLEEELNEGNNYFYRIIPMSDYSTCTESNASETIQFVPGDWLLATEEITRDLAWEVYPNPVSGLDQLNIRIESNKTNKAELQLIDTDGKVAIRRMEQLSRGENSIRWNNGKSIQNGVYMLRILTGRTQATQTIIIQ